MKNLNLIMGLALLLFIGTNSKSFAQDTTKSANIYDMSLEELLNTEITVASKKALTPRETPGIVTLITREEIKNSGYKDLLDLLYTIPGFNFGMDVQNTVGIGLRGIWAHEGKVLLMIDGQEMTDLLYGCNSFYNHISLDQVQKIEIVRGPGSAIYGGSAELSVINIITQSGADLNGAYGGVSLGTFDKTFAKSSYTFGVGKKVNNTSFSLHGTYGESNTSGRNFKDIFGTEIAMPDNFTSNISNMNLNIQHKEFSFRFISDLFKGQMKDFLTTAMPDSVVPFQNDFLTYLAEVKYNFKPNEKLTITPIINYKNQKPWYAKNNYYNTFGLDSNYHFYYPDASIGISQTVQRFSGKILTSYDPTDSINILIGIDEYYDYAYANVERNAFYDPDGNPVRHKEYYNFAGFAQAIFKTKIANFTGGVRYDSHSKYGSSFVPRIGITKAFSNFHCKLLFSQSFKSPTIANIEFNNDIKPEKTTVIEAEIGYKLSEKMMVTANVFNIKIHEPIIYIVDSLGEGYKNYESTGSMGAELDFKYVDKHILAGLSYSFYAPKNEVEAYEIPDVKSMTMGFPAHKISARISYRLNNFSATASTIFLGERYGIEKLNSDMSNVEYTKYSPTLLANIYLNYENLFIDGISFGVGVNNILGQDYKFIQPYDGWHAPVPGMDREFFVKLIYTLNN